MLDQEGGELMGTGWVKQLRQVRHVPTAYFN